MRDSILWACKDRPPGLRRDGPAGLLFSGGPRKNSRQSRVYIRLLVSAILMLKSHPRSRPTPSQPSLFGAWSEGRIVAACVALGAFSVNEVSASEIKLASAAEPMDDFCVSDLRKAIREGADPLGDAFCSLRSPSERRPLGATYTPPAIVQALVAKAAEIAGADRVVDPGCGSGRFLLRAGDRFPGSKLIGFEVDPLAALVCRANLAACGLADRSQVMLQDYTTATLPSVSGRTLFIGNPPYVRHHTLTSGQKNWLNSKSAEIGLKSSLLAGLHVYFYLATALKSKPGDFGSFITAAEWLDVNYGSMVRNLFLDHMGGLSLTVIEPTAQPFPDAATTAVVSTFEIGRSSPTIAVSRAKEVVDVHPANFSFVNRDRFAAESRWSHLTRQARDIPEGYIELGELCRVHRGCVTGLNRVWIAGEHSRGLPEKFLFASVTRARDIFSTDVLRDSSTLRRVIDLPDDLDELDEHERERVLAFVKVAQRLGAAEGYVARNRKAWWSVGLRKPAPILATYMARRPPKFVMNEVDARHINIAHGLYPRETLSEDILRAIAHCLSSSVSLNEGRTYAGGLTKFEPREMERLLIPHPSFILEVND